MEELKAFSIPIRELESGIHHFDYQIDHSFFQHFEDSPIKAGKYEVQLDLDKRSNLLVLDFDVKGAFQSSCDRCLAEISLPIEGAHRLLVKYADEASEEDEVVYIEYDSAVLNISQYIYECIILQIPLVHVYDCENDEKPVCDQEMLKHLEHKEAEEPKDNPIWDELKKLGDK